MKKNKIGLALGSGGAKGLAHVGVLKVLEEHNIPIDFIAGSSIGALVGAYYASHPDSSKLENLAISFGTRKGMQLFDLTWKGGLIKGNKIENIISELLEGATFESLNKPFAAVATDFNTAEEVTIQDGDLVKAIRASISVPGFLQPVVYGERLLADAGLSEPVPTDITREMGADIVIAVNLDTIYSENALAKIPPLSFVPGQTVNILRHNLALESAQTADIIICPKVSYVGILGWNYFFHVDKIQSVIKAGEGAALEAIPKIKTLIARKQKKRSTLQKMFSFFSE